MNRNIWENENKLHTPPCAVLQNVPEIQVVVIGAPNWAAFTPFQTFEAMRRIKPLRRFTAGIDKAFDKTEADTDSFVSLAQHGHTFNATADFCAGEPEFAGPSFCFRDGGTLL